MPKEVKAPRRAYRLKDLSPYVGLSRSRIMQLIRTDGFPPGVQISPKCRTRIWFEDDLSAWQDERRAATS